MTSSNSKNSESSTHQKEYHSLYWLIITRSLWLSRFKKTVFVQRSLTTWYDPTGLRLFNPFCWRTTRLWLDFGTYFIAVSQTNLEFLEQTFIFEDKYLKSRQNQSYQTLMDYESLSPRKYTTLHRFKGLNMDELGRQGLNGLNPQGDVPDYHSSAKVCDHANDPYSHFSRSSFDRTIIDYQPFLISWPAWWTTPMTHWTLKILFIIRATG